MDFQELRRHADRLRFTPQEPVRWLAPREPARTAVQVCLADMFADYMTVLEWAPARPETPPRGEVGQAGPCDHGADAVPAAATARARVRRVARAEDQGGHGREGHGAGQPGRDGPPPGAPPSPGSVVSHARSLDAHLPAHRPRRPGVGPVRDLAHRRV
ncbi:hypothetical protein GCM10010299_55350 [Streptomyces tanashiensis]|nr:hypothetical protein GCM10010299_55350 [Streptomyces tanashiensis]